VKCGAFAGAKVTSTDSDRLTALHVAAQEGCVDCVKVLVEHGADVTAMSRHGDMPLSLAARHGQSPARLLRPWFRVKIKLF